MRLTPVLLLAVLTSTACESPPIEWSDPVAIARPSADARLVVDSGGRAQFVSGGAATVAPPAVAGLCASSFRTAQGTRRLFAIWWSVRPDSSAVLYMAASSDSGRTWGTAAAVDTSDVGSRGCNRPAPSAATVDDDLYVAYSMAASDGTGVFFAHFMGSMLHSPVAVIYGERLVATAIATDGERVAVAYDDPNGKRQRVSVALSMTQGHIFETHETATRDIDVASDPSVALRGRVVAVAWAEQKFAGGDVSALVRVGRVR